MPHLDLGTALLIWMLASTLAHEYGHSFMAKLCGYKTIGFFASPMPGVLPEPPSKKGHAVLFLLGGWIFGVLTIPLFLLFIAPEYGVIFLTTALVIETFGSGSDFMGATAFSKYYEPEYWLGWMESMFKTHNKIARYGLSKMVIIDREKFDALTKELSYPEHSIAFFDKMGVKGWVVLLSLLALYSALMVAFVNWPVFGILSWFGVEIGADFSVLFGVLAGTTVVLTITERLILQCHKKRTKVEK